VWEGGFDSQQWGRFDRTHRVGRIPERRVRRAGFFELLSLHARAAGRLARASDFTLTARGGRHGGSTVPRVRGCTAARLARDAMGLQAAGWRRVPGSAHRTAGQSHQRLIVIILLIILSNLNRLIIFFAGRFLRKCVVKRILKIQPYLAYVATLPCETLTSAKKAIKMTNYNVV